MSRGLAILSGLAQGTEKAATNLYNINQAKVALKEKEARFSIFKKKSKLEIADMEYTSSPEQRELRDREAKNLIALSQARIDVAKGQIKTAENKNTQDFDQHTAAMKMVKDFLESESTVPEGSTVRIGGASVSRRGTTGSDVLFPEDTNVNIPNNLPDASLYEEGSVVEDDKGNTWKVVNGQWSQ